MIYILDYDMGNVGSIYNILKKVTNEKIVISRDLALFAEADKYILPGVGSFDSGMNNLRHYNFVDCLNEQVILNKKPLLGICLGMQLLGRKSEEGLEDGLGYISFDSVRFNLPNEYKIPHMGWDYVNICNKEQHSILENFEDRERYYFVHSFHAKCDAEENILMTCTYGYSFAAAVVKENIYGVQFHPEKSHKYGMKLLKNFAEI